MTCDIARERLQDQIDESIDPVIARDLERHLESCAACRALAADLSAIADAAASLDPIEAPEHVWLQLAGRWRAEQGVAAPAEAPRRTSNLFHVLAAAAVLTVAVGGGWIAWRATDTGTEVILPRPAATASAEGNAPPTALVESAMDDIAAAEQLYTRAIAGLEQAAAGQRDLLEPHVAAALDTNLGVLDEAIGQSRAAVQAQPESVIARESLFEALRKKVTLLQNTISLVSEISRGNQAGATRLSGT
jgi:predicted anti-sigma-YlaC factor YlaD